MGRIIGIDLGTTNSAAAFWDMDQPRMIPNDRGSYITPSVAAFNRQGEVLVGEAARNQILVNNDRTVSGVKRAMGTESLFLLGDRRYSPEEISALILKKIKDDAESFLDETITDAVITVPAYFNEKQRRATQEAGQAAGFRVRRILNEPTAAALVYGGEGSGGDRAEGEEIILVYDLGGGTFDISLLRRRGKIYEVIATRGDNHLGGMDFDNMLMEMVIDRFQETAYPEVQDDPLLMQQLREQVERVKIELSSQEEASVVLPFFEKKGKTSHFVHTVSRRDFEDMIQPFIERTGDLVQGTLRDGGVGPEEVQIMILSGGSSRIPLVSRHLYERFGWKSLKQVNPDETVALGAAIQSAFLDKEDLVLRDVTPFSLGIEVVGGECISVIDRNSPLPIRGKRVFTTVEDNQESVEVHVLQGESALADDNLSLGRFLLSGIRGGTRGEPRIEVSFVIDVDGILHVEARDRDTGARQKVTLSSEGSLKDSEGKEELFARIKSLQRRLEMLLSQKRESLERSFFEGIEEEMAETLKGLSALEVKDIRERRLWLESLIGEVHARVQNREDHS